MTELMKNAANTHAALLPAGLSDLLPPGAEQEAWAISRLMDSFRSYGYQRVRAPLVEFEESLTGHGAGAALTRQTFRLMDPVSQRMMGVRADITPQISRIARTRLGDVARPLRLCYAGPVLRVNGTQLRPSREFTQLGCEIVGSLSPAADAEILILAIESLSTLGIDGLSIDLCVPTLLPVLCHSLAVDYRTCSRLRAAVSSRDEEVLQAIGGESGRLALELLATSGPADRALEMLGEIELPEGASQELERLFGVWPSVRKALSGVKHAPEITLDVLEQRGFEYQSGLSFTIFVRGGRGELGRGGRYRAVFPGYEDDVSEPAVGFSLYTDSLMPVINPVDDCKRVYVPVDCDADLARDLRKSGWVVVAGLDSNADDKETARSMGCDYILDGGECRKI